MVKEAKKIIIIILTVVLIVASANFLDNNPVLPAGLSERSLAAEMETDVDDPFAEDMHDNGDITDAEDLSKSDVQLFFSLTGHFYESEIFVSITASSPDATIYYTLDGSEPTIDSSKLTGVIRIAASLREDIRVVPVRAIAVTDDIPSRSFAHTYFIGPNIFNRFNLLVFSLSTDADYLYDYETGIFVEGITRDEYIRTEGVRRRDIIPPNPANFNWRGMEGERPVYVEVFEPNGDRVIAQAAGMRVHGGWSRAADQKSIRLVARNMYEPGHGKFHFDFFPDDTIRDDFDTPLRKYDQLVLRNGANDRDFGMIRNEVGLELARMAGLQVVPPVRPAAIFLNGEYYGFAWLQVRVNEQYLQDIYNAPTRDFQIVGMGEYWIVTDDPEERRAIEHFNSFYTKDLTNDAIFEEFKELVDIDQLLLYYALQTYLGNHDWPNNNIKRWRYTGPQEDGLPPELDGRWRYVVFDLDWILGLYEGRADPNKPSFQEMMDPRNERFSHMLNALFKRQDMVDQFSMIMCDLAENVVTSRNVNGLIVDLFSSSRSEIRRALAADKYAGWVSLNSVSDNHSNMRSVAAGRSRYIFRSLRDHFGFSDDMFTVLVSGAEAYIGTQISTRGYYFDHLTVPLRPALTGFDVFDHWVVNGVVIDTPEITVSSADIVNGIVHVELITREVLPLLIFSEAYEFSSRSNGCVLYNPGSESVSTRGLYITNDRENPFRWALPEANIEPGGILELAGRRSRDTDDIHKIMMDFNVRQGRNLYLFNDAGEVVTHTTVRGTED